MIIKLFLTTFGFAITFFPIKAISDTQATSGEKSPIINNESGSVIVNYGKPFEKEFNNKVDLFDNPYAKINKDDFNEIKDYALKSKKLRHGYQYSFHNSFNNNFNDDIGISQAYATFSEADGNFNGADNPTFSFTKEIKDNFFIKKDENVKIINSDALYPIVHHPEKRSADNLFIIYKTIFYLKEHGAWIKKPNLDIHTQPYEITWCGDGIIDNYTDITGFQVEEECDPNDYEKINWGKNGCMKNLCKPIN